MKVLWIAGLPEEVRLKFAMTDAPGAAWSWVIGSLPPPPEVELHIVCPVFGMARAERHFDYAGAHWHCFRLRRFEPLFLRRRFARQIRPFVRALRPDAVHGWGGESGCGLVATYLSPFAVVSVQGLLRMLKTAVRQAGLDAGYERGFAHGLRGVLERLAYRRARVLVCESETAQRELKAGYGRDAEIVPYPLRREFLEDPRTTDAPADVGATRPRVLFVGQNVPRKGYADSAKACAGVADLVRAENLTASELVDQMRMADAIIVPSYGDTGPTALKEALAQGVFPIAYDNTGAAELLRRYGVGALVPTGDVDALRRAVVGLRQATANPAARADVARRVRSDLSRECAWEGYLDAYARALFAVPPSDQLQGAVGQRVRHFAKMLRGSSATGRVVLSFQTGVRQNLAAVLRAWLSGRKAIREINEWPLSVTWGESRFKQWFEMRVLPKLFDGFVCISDVLAEFCRENGRRGVPVLKVPMTVDCDEIDAAPRGDADEKGRPLVVYAGSASEAKDGVETLRRVMAGIDATLRVVSGRPRPEALAEMKCADCLVLARPDSQQARAGFPTKLGEYLATGVPVVVTATGEIPRYLTDGVDAYLVRPGDEAALAEKIRYVLADPQTARKVGATGRETARRSFDWRNHGETLREWLRQFI